LDTYKFPLNIFQFSKQKLWTLFLMAAFPTHVWTIILVLQDYSWVTERTNSWDAIGVGAYGLLVAFAESVFVFVVALVLSLLISRKWDQDRRLALLFVTIFVVAIWAIINQLYFLFGATLPGGMMRFLIDSAHPLRILYGTSFAIASISVVLPYAAVLQSDEVVKGIETVMERLSILTVLYLFLDVVGLIIVVIRNLA
jgi:hypothetical protein